MGINNVGKMQVSLFCARKGSLRTQVVGQGSENKENQKKVINIKPLEFLCIQEIFEIG